MFVGTWAATTPTRTFRSLISVRIKVSTVNHGDSTAAGPSLSTSITATPEGVRPRIRRSIDRGRIVCQVLRALHLARRPLALFGRSGGRFLGSRPRGSPPVLGECVLSMQAFAAHGGLLEGAGYPVCYTAESHG